MKITKLAGSNFRTLKGKFEIPLNGETINLFYAENNGAGKTSALYAFLFLVADYSSGKTKDECVNWDSETMNLVTEFEHNGINFKIEYDYNKGKQNKTLTINNEEFSGISTCNKKLKEYFDPSLFIPSVFIEQNAKNFTSIKPSDRRDNLKKIFNLDYSQEIKEIEKEEKELQDKEISVVEKNLIIEKSKTFELKELMTSTNTEEEYEEFKKNIETLTSEIARLSNQIQDVETQKQKKSNVEKRIKEEKESLLNLKNKKQSFESKILELENFKIDDSIIKDYEEKISSIKLERVKQFDEDELKTTKQNVANKNAELKTLKKQLQDCKDGICPTCGKDFSSHDTESINKEIDLLQSQLDNLNETVKKLEEEKNTYEEAIKSNESKKRDKELFQSKIESEQKRLDREKEINERDLLTYKEELESINFSTIEETIATLEKELSSIIIKDISECEIQIEENKKEKQTFTTMCENFESIKNKNELIEQDNKKIIEDEKICKQNIVSLEKSLDELTIKKQQLNKMKNFLKKEFPSYVISSMVEQIEISMNEFISKVYYKDLDVEIIANDDTIDVLYGTGVRKVDAINASGAEESLLALSYCYSLNKLKNFNLLLMDEVDSSFTQDASMELANMIQKIKDEYDFIGIISHVDVVKDYYEMNGANMVNVDEVII